jgi:hypothetical protein
MAETGLLEIEIPGPVPRLEIPAWRERFGVFAGITGRGAGEAGFDLGLWTSTAEPVGTVMARWDGFRAAAAGFHTVVSAHQVHGTDVAWHGDGEGWRLLEGLDGHLTGSPGVLLTITVADCVPVYLVDPVSRIIGLLHAGWRGVASGIVGHGVRLMQAHGASVNQIVMHCGVGICGACYEVGADVMAAWGLAASGDGPWYLDLRGALATQATALGVKDISTSQFCSVHDHGFFYSHRASRGQDGRMVAYLGLLP